MFHIVVAHRYQLYHDESREGCNEEHIELKLRILEQIFDLEFDDGCIEQGEITPDRKQKKAQMYSSAGEWKNEVLLLCVENPPVAVVVIA